MSKMIEYDLLNSKDPYALAAKTVDEWKSNLKEAATDSDFDQLKFAIAILIRDFKRVQPGSTFILIEVSNTNDAITTQMNGSSKILTNAIAVAMDNENVRGLIDGAAQLHYIKKFAKNFTDGKQG